MFANFRNETLQPFVESQVRLILAPKTLEELNKLLKEVRAPYLSESMGKEMLATLRSAAPERWKGVTVKEVRQTAYRAKCFIESYISERERVVSAP